MASRIRFPYHRLKYGEQSDEEAKEEVRSYRRIRNFLRFRGFNINRRRLKVHIPGLKKFLRKRGRLLSRMRVSWGKALKKVKNGKGHMNDLFGGNYLVMQLGPASFKCCQEPSYRLPTYSSKKSALARVSEDFMPREPMFQTLHIACLLLGEIVVRDWDMFHSKHETAEFHGAARALGGCAVYVSDKPGDHDFNILKKLVLPDGSILRARHAGRPRRDCLFVDPVMDEKSLLKIWNLNQLSGLIGVFNCQGAGSWPLKQEAKVIPSAQSKPSSLSGHVRPMDVEFLEEVAGEDWNGDCAVYAFNTGSVSVCPKNEHVEVCLGTLQREIYTISPIRVFGKNICFAPIRLVDMYNSGGAVEAVNCKMDFEECIIRVNARGCGRFGAYTSTKPECCMVDNQKKDFSYNAEGLLTFKLDDECNLIAIEFVYFWFCVQVKMQHGNWAWIPCGSGCIKVESIFVNYIL